MTTNLDPLSTAYAWAAVRLAASNDPNRPAMYRTVEIGQYPTGNLYTCVDGYSLLQAWVPDLEWPWAPQPDTDEAPTAVIAAQDPDNVALDMIRRIRSHKPAELEPGTFLRFRDQRSQPDATQQRLTPEMSPKELVLDFAAGEQTVAIPVNEHLFPDWRHIVAELGERGPTASIAYSDVILSTVSKLAKMLGCPVQFEFGAGVDAAARIVLLEPKLDEAISLELSGFVMPVRTVEAAAAIDEAS